MAATATEEALDQALFEELMGQVDLPYVIVVLDDDVTPMDYVVAVFVKHFELSVEVATERMWEVHRQGRSVLASGSQEEMQAHHEAMGRYRLRSKVERAS